MQDHIDTQPLQTILRDIPAPDSMGHAPIPLGNVTSGASRPSKCEESTLGLPSAATQFVLLVIILYAARKQYPQLELTVLVACGAMFVLLLVWKTSAARRRMGTKVPERKHTAKRQPRQRTQQEANQPRTPNMTGVWIKDKAASDSMEPTLDMMKINRLIRSAVRLVKGTQLKQSENSFEITVLSGILWFKIREEYPLTGEVRRFKRRDLRKGLHKGVAEHLPDGAVCVTLEWDEPLGGIGTDVFYVPAPKLLYVDSTIVMHGQTVKYRTIYHKQS
ncbi:hypothetical protein ABBQ38_001930 [Trebouxia sp. C0009 RCD-2024]